MANQEKPRLKDTDEILDSLAVGGRRREQPGAPQSAEAEAGGGEPPAAPPRRRRPRTTRAAVPAPEVEDHSPLDFGKYQLSDPTPGEDQSLEALAAQAVLESPPAAEPETAPKASRARTAAPRRRRAAPQQPPPSEEPAPEAVAAAQTNTQNDMERVQEYQFDSFDPSLPAPEPAPQKPRTRRRKKAEPKAPEPEPAPQPPKPKIPPEDPRRAVVEDPDYRDAFMERIGSEFDRMFTEKFYEGNEPPDEPVPAPAPGPKPRGGARPPRQEEAPPPRREAPRPAPRESAREEEPFRPEADSFIQEFTQAIQAEESEQTESFKDTLAQKFMRERERYLKELGIAEEMEQEAEAEPEPEVPQKPARKRLDFHIRPEMHMQGADGGVTYGRDASTRALEEEEEDGESDDTPPTIAGYPVPPAPAGKKTGEDLIQELARQVEEAQVRFGDRPPRPQVLPPVRTGDDAGDGEPAARRKLPKTAVIVAATAVLTLALVLGVPALVRSFTADPVGEPSSAEELPALAGDTMVIYESRNPESPVTTTDAVIKRPNISVSNYVVERHLIIEEIDTPGTIHLENVTVGGNIYLRSSALEGVTLRDVSADRIIVNNSQGAMELVVEGQSDIQTLEVKSPLTVREDTLPDAPGIAGVLVENDGGATALEFVAEGLNVRTLATIGETVVNSRGTAVETMTAEGSLSLHGDGRVLSLSVGMQGESPLSVLIKGVQVSNLGVKSPGTLNLSSDIDNLALSDPASIGGNGIVGTLTVNEKFGNSRLLLDFAGVRVQTLIANAESRINCAGTAQINTLVANASTYVMGNKVNHLQVNHDRVIYEHEPDRITTTAGIRPPETVADNPNLDYSLPTNIQADPFDTSLDAVSTLCGHTRESGGFLEGDGSAENPYLIESAAQLMHISLHLDSHYRQTADIDCADESSFTMIGGPDEPFRGSYDGGGYSIRNVRITSSESSVGLFAENVGEIRGVTILSGEIRSNATARAYVGGIAGLNHDGGLISASSNAARIVAQDTGYAGGIAGYNYGGRIRDCFNTARVSGAAHSGGIAGINRQEGSIARCYSTGIIEGDIVEGAIVGTNEASTVTNCYFLADSVPNGIGAGEGSAISVSDETLRSSQMVADLSAGNDNTPWRRGADYPVLAAETPSPASTAADTPDTPSSASPDGVVEVPQ